MPGERFFDTNVLIYAFASGDPRNPRAEELLAEGNCRTTALARWE